MTLTKGNKWILTAAHCTTFENTEVAMLGNQIKIYFGGEPFDHMNDPNLVVLPGYVFD